MGKKSKSKSAKDTTKCTFGISSPKPAAEADLVMGQADVVDPAADQFRYFQQDWPACNSLEEFIERIHRKSYPLDVQRWASAYQVHIDGETDDWRSLVLRGAKKFLADLMQNQIVQGNHLHRQLLEKLQGVEEELQVFAYTQLAPVPWMPLLMPDGVLILKLNILCTSFKYYKEEEGMKKKTKKQRELSPAETAFHSEPCGRDAVTPVYREIVDFYGEFDPGVYHSPYTSVVGPSGIGKSYLISQIAKKRLAYVVYFNWADHVSTSYPGRSLITDTFNLAINPDELQRLFEVFFGMNLVLVNFCRELCITPAAFFDMQTKEDFERFQEEIDSHLLEFHLGTTKKLAAEHVRIRSEDDREKFDYQKYVQEYLAGINGQLRAAIINVYMQLLNDKNCPEEYFTPWENLKVKPDHPEAIICLDEARGLFEITPNSLEEDEGPAWRFLAFRRALRHQSKIDPTTDSKRLFGLLLDTVSRVTDFSPPTHDDPSTREANANKLFPPIWRLDTLDTFTDNATAASTVQVRSNNQPPVTMDYRKLFSLGRPLWGALLRTGTPQEAMERVITLAQSKILRARENKPFVEGRQMELLALLSYRMNFHVSVQGLAEELASGYMRYVVAVNENRTLLRTMQPSEPLLAHIATRLMQRSGPQGRLELIKVFYNFATEGFINVGDIGEAVAALVLLFTWERAHNRLHFDQDAKPQHVFYPVPIVEFLRTLVPQNVFTEMEGFAKLDEDLTRVWRGYVFFNHMVRVREKVTEENLRQAFNRGAAILLQIGRAGADILIPIFMPENDSMSWFLVQVKNRKDDSMTNARRNEARNALTLATTHLPNGKRAHLGMMMCLRSPKPEAMNVVYPNTLYGDPPEYSWNSGKRVIALSCGLSANLFPGLGFTDTPSREPEIVQSIDYLKEMLNYISENLKEEGTAYYQGLYPLG